MFVCRRYHDSQLWRGVHLWEVSVRRSFSVLACTYVVLEVTIAFRVFANIIQFGFEIKIEMLC